MQRGMFDTRLRVQVGALVDQQLCHLRERACTRDMQRCAVIPIHALEVSARRYILLDAIQISPRPDPTKGKIRRRWDEEEEVQV